MVYQDIYNVLTGITSKVYYKTIPENYNFSDLLVVYTTKKLNNIIFNTDEQYNLKIKIYHKSEETCIITSENIINAIIVYKNSTIRKIELNYTDTLYDDLLDVNFLIIDMTITNDLE
jgi:hypothetical protein